MYIHRDISLKSSLAVWGHLRTIDQNGCGLGMEGKLCSNFQLINSIKNEMIINYHHQTRESTHLFC